MLLVDVGCIGFFTVVDVSIMCNFVGFFKRRGEVVRFQ